MHPVFPVCGHVFGKEMIMLPRLLDPVLPPPPPIHAAGHALFIDFDGTLVPIAERPDDVTADPDLIALLGQLHARLDDRLTLVSGRSIAQLDAMIGPIAAKLSLVGSHGLEIRRHGRLTTPPRAPGLDDATAEIRAFAADHPGLIVEEKSLGVALHYRTAPDLAAAVDEAAAAIGAVHGLVVQPGKMMVELRGSGCDKGSAVAVLMARPSRKDCRPIMIGDDLTDEPAFVLVETIGGFGILIGHERETAASFSLPDVASLRNWLWQIAWDDA
jgi:trehalose 6-phosphate phosphatase